MNASAKAQKYSRSVSSFTKSFVTRALIVSCVRVIIIRGSRG